MTALFPSAIKDFNRTSTVATMDAGPPPRSAKGRAKARSQPRGGIHQRAAAAASGALIIPDSSQRRGDI